MARKPRPASQQVTTQRGLDVGLTNPNETSATIQLVLLTEVVNPPAKEILRYTPEEWEGMTRSILENGLELPISVRPHKDGGYEIVDGRHRFEAFRRIGKDRIAAIVRRDHDDLSAAVASLVANAHRKAGTPYNEAWSFGKAREAGATVAEIAKRAGVSETTVRDRLALLDVPEALGRQVGVLRGLTAERVAPLAVIKNLPDEARKHVEKAVVKAIPKNPHQWFDPAQVAAEALVDGGHGTPYEHYLGRVGYANQAALDKAVKKVGHVEIAGNVVVTEPDKLEVLVQAIEKKVQAAAAEEAEEKADAARAGLVDSETKKLAARLRRDLIKAKVNAQVAMTPDAEYRLWLRAVGNRSYLKAADQKWLVDCGIPEKAVAALCVPHYADPDDAVLRSIYDDADMRRNVTSLLLAHAEVVSGGDLNEDLVKEWTGKTPKEIEAAARKEARAVVAEKLKRAKSRAAKAAPEEPDEEDDS